MGLPLESWEKATGTILVGPEVSGQNILPFSWRGRRAQAPLAQRGLGPWPLCHLVCPVSVHSSPRPLGTQDGHWGAVRARTPGRDPPRGARAASPAKGDSLGWREPSRGSAGAARTPAVLPLGALGSRSVWVLGIFLRSRLQPLLLHNHTHTYTHTPPTPTRAPPSPTLCLHAHTDPGGLQRPQVPSWECRDCGFSFCFSPSRQPRGSPVQAPQLDAGASPWTGPCRQAPPFWWSPSTDCTPFSFSLSQ